VGHAAAIVSSYPLGSRSPVPREDPSSRPIGQSPTGGLSLSGAPPPLLPRGESPRGSLLTPLAALGRANARIRVSSRTPNPRALRHSLRCATRATLVPGGAWKARLANPLMDSRLAEERGRRARARACDAGTPANGVSVETRLERGALDAAAGGGRRRRRATRLCRGPSPCASGCRSRSPPRLLPPDRARAASRAADRRRDPDNRCSICSACTNSRYLQRGRRALLLTPATALGIQLLLIAAAYFFRSDLVFPRSVLVLFTAFKRRRRRRAARRRAAPGWARVEPRTRIALVGAAVDVADFRPRGWPATDPGGRRYEGGRDRRRGRARQPRGVHARRRRRGDPGRRRNPGRNAFLGQLLCDGSTRARGPASRWCRTCTICWSGGLSSLQVAERAVDRGAARPERQPGVAGQDGFPTTCSRWLSPSSPCRSACSPCSRSC